MTATSVHTYRTTDKAQLRESLSGWRQRRDDLDIYHDDHDDDRLAHERDDSRPQRRDGARARVCDSDVPGAQTALARRDVPGAQTAFARRDDRGAAVSTCGARRARVQVCERQMRARREPGPTSDTTHTIRRATSPRPTTRHIRLQAGTCLTHITLITDNFHVRVKRGDKSSRVEQQDVRLQNSGIESEI